jgi:hypothetical protein
MDNQHPIDAVEELLEQSHERLSMLQTCLLAISEHVLSGDNVDKYVDGSFCFGLAHTIGDIDRGVFEAKDLIGNLPKTKEQEDPQG